MTAEVGADHLTPEVPEAPDFIFWSSKPGLLSGPWRGECLRCELVFTKYDFTGVQAEALAHAEVCGKA